MVYRMVAGEPRDFFFVPQKALEMLSSCDGTEIKILLLLSSKLSVGAMEEEDIINSLSEQFSGDEIKNALSFWRGAGVLSVGGKKETVPEEVSEKKPKIDTEEVPFYTAKELGDAAEKNPEFKSLVSFAEDRMKKIMNESELAKLYSFVDYLKMPVSVIMLSIEDCVSRGKPSLRYIAKQLMDFEENGADTYEKAEALLKSRAELCDYEHYVRKLFGLGDRKLIAKESKAVKTWMEEWKFGREMLDIAYEKTVQAAKTPSISYMNKILESWHENGITEPSETEGNKVRKADAEKSYELNDFFSAAVAKSKKNH